MEAQNSTNIAPNVSSSDRLGFTVFVAIALHLILIMGLGFEAFKTTNKPTTIEVTLAKFEHNKEPEKADFLAQMNQQGSGQPIEEAQKLTTTEKATIQDSKVNLTSPSIEVAPPAPVDQKEEQAAPNDPAPQVITLTDLSLIHISEPTRPY